MEIVEALKTKAIKDCEIDEIIDVVMSGIQAACFSMGIDILAIDIASICAETSKMLKRRYDFIKIGELEIVFERGGMGDLGGHRKVSARDVKEWIEAYRKLPERVEAVLKNNDRLEKIEVQRATEKEYFDFCDIWYQKFCESNDLGYAPSMIYSFLQEQKIISNTSAEKWQAVAESKLQCVNCDENTINSYAMRNLLASFFQGLKNEGIKSLKEKYKIG